MNATRTARRVNPSAPITPRDSWPAWTDTDRWTPVDADHRPTAGPDFVPSAADEAAAAELFRDDSSDALADDAAALDALCSGYFHG